MGRMKMQVAGIKAAFADIISQTEEEMSTVLRIWGEKALPFVQEQWPRKTGKSRAALGLEIQGEDVYLSCAVDYAGYIYQKGTVGPTWKRFMVDGLIKLTPTINALVTAQLVRER